MPRSRPKLAKDTEGVGELYFLVRCLFDSLAFELHLGHNDGRIILIFGVLDDVFGSRGGVKKSSVNFSKLLCLR